MTKVGFSQFYYFPCIQSSEPEQIGYSELSEADKDSVLPIVEMSQIKNEASFEETLAAVAKLVPQRPFILDLSKDRAPPAYVAKLNPDEAKIAKVQAAQDAYNANLTALLTPAEGFANWRALVAKFPNAIPVLQFTDPEVQGKNVLRQAALLAKAGVDQIAVRITQETSEALYPIIGQVAAILDTAAQLLIIVDCGQGRTQIAERAEFAKIAISRILGEMEPAQALQLSAVCLSDSYKNPPEGQIRLYESLSWGLWEQASEKFPFLFGDYAANNRIKKTTTFMPGDWKAQVIYALPESWIVYRHPNAQDAQGWVEGAKAVLGHDSFDHENDCWGSKLLDRAAKGDIEGAASARFWHGAKINMHIHRQIRHAEEKMSGP